MSRKNHNKIIKTFKDYLVPIIWVLLILIIIINSLSSNDSDIENNKEQSINYLDISLENNETQAYIVYPWDNKQKIELSWSITKWEKVFVESWNVSINLLDNSWTLSLNTNWRFKYDTDWTYVLYSSDLWWEVTKDFNIKMNFVTLDISAGSIFNLNQNEIASNIYVLSWIIKVKNFAWVETILWAWEKITIIRNEATNKDIDLTSKKEEIPEYFKEEDWFIKNNWNISLGNEEVEITSTGSIEIKEEKYITFNSIQDEQEFNSDNILVEGSILNNEVTRITINWEEVEIYTDSSSFSFKNLSLKNKVNDIVYKLYNEDDDLLKKGIITLYNLKAAITSSAWLSVENYSLDSSVFKFISPKENPYTTTEKLVRIDGSVPVWKVTKILVNWYQLKKFRSKGSNWYYFANTDYGNLKDWLNIYNIEYFGEDWKVLYSNAFTIIKEAKKENIPQKYSDEVKVN